MRAISLLYLSLPCAVYQSIPKYTDPEPPCPISWLKVCVASLISFFVKGREFGSFGRISAQSAINIKFTNYKSSVLTNFRISQVVSYEYISKIQVTSRPSLKRRFSISFFQYTATPSINAKTNTKHPLIDIPRMTVLELFLFSRISWIHFPSSYCTQR